MTCIKCSYDLSGLESSGVCPECGCRIQDSMHSVVLANCDPKFINRLHQGVVIIEIAIIFLLTQAILALFYLGLAANIDGSHPTPIYAVILNYLLPLYSVLLLIGWWRFSTKDPSCPPTYSLSNARNFLLAMQIVATIASVAQAVLYAQFEAGYILVLGGMICVLRYISEVYYISKTTPIFQSDKIERRALMLIWAGPCLMIFGAVCVGFGPIIAFALYWNMLDWIRKDLKAIRAAH